MNTIDPGLFLLFASALCVFWLTPISAWWMLAGESNPAARIWFFGTSLYALAATFFIFGPLLPFWVHAPLTSALSTASLFCLYEALRREISIERPPFRYYGAVLVLDIGLVLASQYFKAVLTWGIAAHLTLITAIEIIILALIVRVQRDHKSRSLWLIFVVLTLFAISNLSRVLSFLVTGSMPRLLDFSIQGNLGIIINYSSVIFYCYGYWGFVVEKNKRLVIKSAEEAAAANNAAQYARYREKLNIELFEQRSAFLERLAKVERTARSAALAASIAHEINQPLAALAINVGEAKRLGEIEKTSERLMRLLGRISNDNDRIAAIIARLRNMFSDQPLQPDYHSLDALIRLFADYCQEKLKNNEIQIQLCLNAPDKFLFSAGEIEHVLQNLIQNAVDSLKNTDIKKKWISVETWMNREYVYLAVEDNGAGLTDTDPERIFAMMESDKENGMGLGLWLSKFIVERHGGSVRVEQAQYGGARFVVELPKRINTL